MSRAFHFSMQKVLDVREALEEQKALQLQLVEHKLQLEEQNLERLNDEKDGLLAQTANHGANGGALDLLQLRVALDYIAQVSSRIQEQENIVKNLERQTAQKRAELLNAAKEKKVMEKLKERHLEQYIKERRKIESRQEGELALLLNRRKKRENHRS